VHEVKTDPRQRKDLAFFSCYSAGLRVASFGPRGLPEAATTSPKAAATSGACSRSAPASASSTRSGRGSHNAKRPLLLMSDRDSGLWILRYTGKE